MNIILVLVFFSVVYFSAHLFAGLFSRTKIPDVLWLIIIGLSLGPISGIVAASELDLVGPVFAALALVIILFESGLSISLGTLIKTLSQGIWLTVVNFLVSFAVTGVIFSLFTHLPLLNSLLLGAIITGISPAVVIPLLSQLQLRNESITILKLESALADVLCIVSGLALLDANKGIELNLGVLIRNEMASFLFACILGITGAIIWAIFLNKMRTIRNSVLATPAFVVLIFGAAESIQCSGYVAALVFGITIGNIELLRRHLSKVKLFKLPIKNISTSEINEFEKSIFSEVVFLLKTFFFVYIGLSIKLTDAWLLWVGLILAAVVFIVRIPIVRFSISKTAPVGDVSYIAVMVPKGLATAALASLPLQQGVAGGEIIQNVAFAVVLFSVVLTSVMIFLIHKTPLSKFYRWIFSGFGAALL